MGVISSFIVQFLIRLLYGFIVLDHSSSDTIQEVKKKVFIFTE